MSTRADNIPGNHGYAAELTEAITKRLIDELHSTPVAWLRSLMEREPEYRAKLNEIASRVLLAQAGRCGRKKV